MKITFLDGTATVTGTIYPVKSCSRILLQGESGALDALCDYLRRATGYSVDVTGCRNILTL